MKKDTIIYNGKVYSFDEWTTPMKYAKEKGEKPSTVLMWVKRGQIENIYVKELKLKLIKKGTEPERAIKRRERIIAQYLLERKKKNK